MEKNGEPLLIDVIGELLDFSQVRENVLSLNFRIFVSEYNAREYNSTFIDNKEQVLDMIEFSDTKEDKIFPNYTDYQCVNSKWNESPKEIKTITLIIVIIKMLIKKNNKQFEDNSKKIIYPIPKAKLSLIEKKNFHILSTLLYLKNDNLLLELIDLIINQLDDPLTFSKTVSSSNLVDVLVFHMLRFKSSKILNYIGKINSYNEIFKQSELPLDDDEQAFFRFFGPSNKMLNKFFPINMIYLIDTEGFAYFLDIISMSVEKHNLIWNINMFEKLFDYFKENALSMIDILEDSITNDKETFSYGDLYPKMKYFTLEHEKKAFIYYLRLFDAEDKEIWEENIDIMQEMSQLLCIKLSQMHDFSLNTERKDAIIYLDKFISLSKSFHLNASAEMNILFELFDRMPFDEFGSIKNFLRHLLMAVNQLIIMIEPHEDKKVDHQRFANIMLDNLDKLVCLYSSNDDQDSLILCGFNLEGLNLIFQRFPHTVSGLNLNKLHMLCVNYKENISERLKGRSISLSTNIMNLASEIMHFLSKVALDFNNCVEIMNSKIVLIILFFSVETSDALVPKIKQLALLTLHNILKNSIMCKDSNYENDKKSIFLSFIKVIQNLLGNYFFNLLLNPNKLDILFKDLMETIFTPEFKWSTKNCDEISALCIKSVNNEMQISEILTKMQEYEFECNSELFKVGNVYIDRYNIDPTFKLTEVDFFVESARNYFIEHNDDRMIEVMFSIGNAVNYSKGNETKLFSDIKFTDKLYDSLMESNLQLVTSCLVFLKNLASRQTRIEHFFKLRNTRCFLYMLNSNQNKEILTESIKLIRNLFKYEKITEKLNLAVFIFYLKIVLCTETSNEMTIFSNARFEVLKLIILYFNNDGISSVMRNVFEVYLPQKIIENTVMVTETNERILDWIDLELELPDLIWNKHSLETARELIQEDCKYLLEKEENLDHFPDNFVKHKLNPQKEFFFDIKDEVRVKGIYARIFNKLPSYNINMSILIFLDQSLKSTKKTLRDCLVLKNNMENNNYESIVSLENIQKKLIMLATTVLLTIEQIYFNDFNSALGISTPSEMKKIQGDLTERDIIGIIQRSFDYRNTISKQNLACILEMAQEIFSDGFVNKEVRLIYMQILFVLVQNKNIAEDMATVNILGIFKNQLKELERISEG